MYGCEGCPGMTFKSCDEMLMHGHEVHNYPKPNEPYEGVVAMVKEPGEGAARLKADLESKRRALNQCEAENGTFMRKMVQYRAALEQITVMQHMHEGSGGCHGPCPICVASCAIGLDKYLRNPGDKERVAKLKEHYDNE